MPNPGSLVKYSYGTREQYKENLISPNSNTAYFITDDGVITVDNVVYSGNRNVFEYIGHFNTISDIEKPQNLNNFSTNCTYACTIGEGNLVYIEVDNEWVQLSKILEGSIAFSDLGDFIIDSTTGITDESTDAQIPTAKAIYDYIENKVSGDDPTIASLDENGQIPLEQIPEEVYTYDNLLDDTSENAVQNKMVTTTLEGGSLNNINKTDEFEADGETDFPLTLKVSAETTPTVILDNEPVTSGWILSNNRRTLHFTTEQTGNIKIIYNGYYTAPGKVDKDGSKVLSTRDFTDKCFFRLQNISSDTLPGHADWDEVDSSKIGYILNRPEVLTTYLKTTDSETIEEPSAGSSTKKQFIIYRTATDDNKIETFVGDGSQHTWQLSLVVYNYMVSGNLTVTINGQVTSNYSYDSNNNTINLNTPPADGAEIRVQYKGVYVQVSINNEVQEIGTDYTCSTYVGVPSTINAHNPIAIELVNNPEVGDIIDIEYYAYVSIPYPDESLVTDDNLMSAKLIEEKFNSINNISVDDNLIENSVNPVQNRVINAALEGGVVTVTDTFYNRCTGSFDGVQLLKPCIDESSLIVKVNGAIAGRRYQFSSDGINKTFRVYLSPDGSVPHVSAYINGTFVRNAPYTSVINPPYLDITLDSTPDANKTVQVYFPSPEYRYSAISNTVYAEFLPENNVMEIQYNTEFPGKMDKGSSEPFTSEDRDKLNATQIYTGIEKAKLQGLNFKENADWDSGVVIQEYNDGSSTLPYSISFNPEVSNSVFAEVINNQQSLEDLNNGNYYLKYKPADIGVITDETTAIQDQRVYYLTANIISRITPKVYIGSTEVTTGWSIVNGVNAIEFTEAPVAGSTIKIIYLGAYVPLDELKFYITIDSVLNNTDWDILIKSVEDTTFINTPQIPEYQLTNAYNEDNSLDVVLTPTKIDEFLVSEGDTSFILTMPVYNPEDYMLVLLNGITEAPADAYEYVSGTNSIDFTDTTVLSGVTSLTVRYYTGTSQSLVFGTDYYYSFANNSIVIDDSVTLNATDQLKISYNSLALKIDWEETPQSVYLQYEYFSYNKIKIFNNATQLVDYANYTYNLINNKIIGVTINSGATEYIAHTDTWNILTDQYTLTRNYYDNLSVEVNGVPQVLDTDYTYDLLTNSITFTTTPSTGPIEISYNAVVINKITTQYLTDSSIDNRPVLDNILLYDSLLNNIEFNEIGTGTGIYNAQCMYINTLQFKKYYIILEAYNEELSLVSSTFELQAINVNMWKGNGSLINLSIDNSTTPATYDTNSYSIYNIDAVLTSNAININCCKVLPETNTGTSTNSLQNISIKLYGSNV